jgi:hypothetical protein
MSTSKHTTLLLTKEDKFMLRKLAQRHGYKQTRGAGAGELGSISALMKAIARGEIQLQASMEANAEQNRLS